MKLEEKVKTFSRLSVRSLVRVALAKNKKNDKLKNIFSSLIICYKYN